jgi:hypothetical protein
VTRCRHDVAGLLQEAVDALDDPNRVEREELYPGRQSVSAMLGRALATWREGVDADPFDLSVAGRLVTDSWPLDSPLSDLVLRAIEAYRDAPSQRSIPDRR